MNEEQYMKIALELARKGEGRVNPNPLVGAIIVKDKNIIAKGYHEKYGGFHAERNALKNCKMSPIDATMYVTLEPCCHYGKTPPCTQAIIESGIKKVVIGCLDPNEKVSGKGVKALIQAGIEVKTGVLEKECKEINEIFFHYIKHQTPFVLMKYAMTLDGKIATTKGHSKWISNEKSRRNVHEIRNQYMAIMVGVGTVIADDPDLTCRLKDKSHPIRIICDSNLKTPLESKVISTATSIRTIIATTSIDKQQHKLYRDKGVEIIVTKISNDKVDLNDLMIKLGEIGVDSILLEGGGSLNFSALDNMIVNKLQCYIAPKIFGGVDAKTPIMGCGFAEVNNKVKIKTTKISNIDDDIMIESEVSYVYRNS